jgi:hypothetical protein
LKLEIGSFQKRSTLPPMKTFQKGTDRGKSVSDNSKFIGTSRGGKNRRALLTGNVEQLQEIHLNEDCYRKFEENLNTHVPLWAQQCMVDRHYSLNLKPWSVN